MRPALIAGTDLTGAQHSVDLTNKQCVNITPAKSATTISAADIEVFFNADCQKGSPGKPSDLHYVLGSLHQGNFPFPAVSYRVR